MRKIAISLGDPAGISYECMVKALPALEEDKAYILYGEEAVLRLAKEKFNPDFKYKPIGDISEVKTPGIYLISLNRVKGVLGIKPSESAGFIAVTYLGRMSADVLRGEIDAIVTLPLSKYWAKKGGKFSFPGQTEFVAFFQKTEEFAMMFYSPELKVVLQTIHIPLKDVAKFLSPTSVAEKLRLIHREFVRFWGKKPKIGVLGLNPHAGEGGLLGTEEGEIIQPAIETVREEGIDCEGPLVPDTAFLLKDRFDVFLAMYHDQGLIPFKLLAFDRGVNLTLGLPVPRTSPDHGTAFDIAWKGICNPMATINAIKLANRLAEKSYKEIFLRGNENG
ncbi:MAG TPA: 4-hydroxythreonine-4-phosphate dehydrogenase PdxA [Aquificales bacterium]|nr:4-hydroxythreonine-4-phosphate dehydrogenase PdxA [Aquificales bacterium]